LYQGKFFQGLTTGEAGAINATIGATAFSLAMYKHVQEEKGWEASQKRER
jgi:hypothetical protein